MVENRASATSKAVLSLADMVKERISKLEADREAEAAKR